MNDNLIYATTTTRTALSNLKKKLSNVRIQLESLTSDIEKIDTKFENVLAQAEIYKSKLEREMGRDVRRLERELALLQKNTTGLPVQEASETDLKVAGTIAIFDTILRNMCEHFADFRLASEAFLFPAVYERVVAGTEEAYYLDTIPNSASLVIRRGQEHIAWIRDEYDTHITDPETWENAIEYIVDWWRNDALPMLYGARDEQWDIDIPYSLPEILQWRESPADRPLNFPKIFDAYEIYRKHKDHVYGTTGIRDFELKLFTFETPKTA